MKSFSENPQGKWVHHDQLVRGSTSKEKLSKAAFRFAKNGTLTASNSSALTDGASCVLLMSEEKALELGFTPLCYVNNWAYSAVDPADQLLIAPALSMPEAARKAGLTIDDIDLFDIHEAFAAQVLCVTKMLASDAFATERAMRTRRLVIFQKEKLNVHGGSVSLGHPAATGARMATTMANELGSTDKKYALLGICAAGGLGASAVLEKYDA